MTKIMNAFCIFPSPGTTKARRRLIHFPVFKIHNVACIMHWEEEKTVQAFNFNV